MDIIDVICDNCQDSTDSNILADWLTEQLGTDGPWDKHTDELSKINEVVAYHLSLYPEPTREIRLTLKRSVHDLNTWLYHFHHYALPVLMEVITEY